MSLKTEPRTKLARRVVASSPAVAGHRPLAIAMALAACFALYRPAAAQPAGAQAVYGSAVLSANGNNLTVTTTNGAGSNHSAINWQSFNVPGGSTTYFAQPNALSTSINRVVTNNPSSIFGTLASNGKLVLVNPSGIAVGAGAVVDTAGFTASTLRMTDADMLAGRLRFGTDGLGGGPLSVNGQIITRGGDIFLISPQVETGAQAVVQAIGGDTVIAAGRKVELTGRGLEGIHLELQAPSDKALNLGTLKGDSVAMFAGQLKHSGLVQAQSATLQGGKVVLKAMGDTLVDGAVTAQAGTRGGSIDLLGGRVAVYGNAVVDASGAGGGGNVRVGGGYQGKDASVPNASQTVVAETASIKADATQAGDGGNVIVWSDGATRMAGNISARGGAAGGNGGFAEVSGMGTLAYTGRTDLRAARGATGTLLLDPTNIFIAQDESSALSEGMSPTHGDASGSTIFTETGDYYDSLLYTSALELALLSSNVKVSTANTQSAASGAGNITLLDPLVWTSTNKLTLAADGDITLKANINGGGALGLVSGVSGNITQQGGVITVPSLVATAANGDVSLGSANNVGTIAGLASGDFTFRSAGAFAVGVVSTPDVAAVTGVTSTAGNVTLQSLSGDLTLNAAVQSAAQDVTLIADTGSIRGAGGAVMAPNGTLWASAYNDIVLTHANNTFSQVQIEQNNTDSELPVSVDVYGKDNYTLSSFNSYSNDPSSAVKISSGADLYVATDVRTAGSLALSAQGSIALVDSVPARTPPGPPPPPAEPATWMLESGLAGGLSVTARGDVDLAGGTLSSNGGTLYVSANDSNTTSGSILGEATINATGNNVDGGKVTLQTKGSGTISVGNIDVSGDGFDSTAAYAGRHGGSVTISSDSGGITTGAIMANGYDAGSSYAGAGGNAGTVSITSGAGNITTGSIDMSGGRGGGASTGSAGGNAGGMGGTLIVKSTGGHVDIEGITAVGGYAGQGYSAAGGAGGKGGTVNIEFGGDLYVGWLDAYGSDGGDRRDGVGGKGGAGGSVSLTTTGSGSITMAGSIDVSGGWGGYGGVSGGSGTGGMGGNAGAIVVQTKGVFAGEEGNVNIYATGGKGGYGFGGDGGRGGNGGAVTVSFGPGSVVGDIDASGGAGGDSLAVGSSVPGPSPAPVAVPGPGVGGEGGKGGSVTVTVDSSTSSAPAVSISSVYALGGDGGNGAGTGSGAAGGEGGTFTLTGISPVTVASTVDVSGGDGGVTGTGQGGQGGQGGTVSISSGAGTLQLGEIYADGGEGADALTSGPGGHGGDGGLVRISTAASTVNIGELISARGGAGGNGTAGTDAGGDGGDGGTLNISGTGTIYFAGDITAVGGDGGRTYAAGAGSARGGDGGQVSVSADWGLGLSAASFMASGGSGGETGAAGAVAGAGGDSGNVSLIAIGSDVALAGTVTIGVAGGLPGYCAYPPCAAPAASSNGQLTLVSHGATSAVNINGTLNLNGGTWTNARSVRVMSGSIQSTGRIVNSGTLDIRGGGVMPDGGVANLAGGTIRANAPAPSGAPVSASLRLMSNLGLVDVASGNELYIYNFTNNQGVVTVNGDGVVGIPDLTTNAGVFNFNGTGSAGLLNLTSNTGTINVNGTRNFSTASLLSNAGSLNVESGASMYASALAGNTGSIHVDGVFNVPLYDPSLSSSSGGLLVNEGTITGSGTLGASIVNRGVIAPGGLGTIGVMSINGTFTQEASGTLKMDVVTPLPGSPLAGYDYDQIAISDTTNLGGTLYINGIDYVAPPARPKERMGLQAPMVVAAPSVNVVATQAGKLGVAQFATMQLTTNAAALQTAVNVGGAPVQATTVQVGPPTAAPPAGGGGAPTAAPTAAPTGAPTAAPTGAPTAAPTSAPTSAPTAAPTAAPTSAPTGAPTSAPTAAPPAPTTGNVRIDDIITVLRDPPTPEVRAQVQQALLETDTVVGKFAALLLKEDSKQSDERKKEENGVTVTSTQCTP